MRTKFVTTIVSNEDSFKAGEEAAKQALHKLGDQKPHFAIAFISSKYDYSKVLKGIKSIIGKVPLTGCSSAGEFNEEKVTKESVVIALISSSSYKFFTGIGKDVHIDRQKALLQACKMFPKEVPDFPYLSAIVLIDGLNGKGEEITQDALSIIGPTVKFSGGAAGDDLKFEKTHVFYEENAYTDALSLSLVASKKPVFIGLKHGHCPISPPLTITKAVDNVLYEVDGKPAFQVWKHYLRDKAKSQGIDVDKLQSSSDIGRFFLRYEAGLLMGNGYKVRAPLSVNKDASLNFGATMIEGSLIRIMESPSKEEQIKSAKEAAEIALAASKGVKIAGAIIFDCACRGIILERDFHKGIEAMRDVLGPIPLIGFETYGEIAMELGQMGGFHNTTSVLVLIPD